MTSVLLVDDHAMVRKGLVQILAREADFGPFGEAGSAREALERVRTDDWDIVLLDFALPDRNGLDTLREIHALEPGLPVLILTMYPEDQLGPRMLQVGAAGYLTKDAAPEELVTAIRRILAGQKYLSDALAQTLASRLSADGSGRPHERLSDRELDVMLLLAAGRQTGEIAARLGVSHKSVTTYRKRLLAKLDMRSNAELTLYASENGLLTPATFRRRWTDPPRAV